MPLSPTALLRICVQREKVNEVGVLIAMAEPDLNGGEEGFASAEGRSDLECEQEHPRKIIHVDRTLSMRLWSSETIRLLGANLSLSAGRGTVVSWQLPATRRASSVSGPRCRR